MHNLTLHATKLLGTLVVISMLVVCNYSITHAEHGYPNDLKAASFSNMESVPLQVDDPVPDPSAPEYLQLEHTFPRLAAFTWGGAVPEYYAQFDLVDWSEDNPDKGLAIKALNPDTRIVVTRDINCGMRETPDFSFPDEWWVRSSSGDICTLYDGIVQYADYTRFAPQLAEFGGKRYNEMVPDLFIRTVDLSVFDGIATDGLWSNYWSTTAPCANDIDLDRNGINDYQEHGGEWVASVILEGAIQTVENMRAAIGPDKLMLINSGDPHAWGMDVTNGFVDEHFNGAYDLNWFLDRMQNWVAGSHQPSTPIIDMTTLGGAHVSPEKNDFQLMRFGLAISLVTGTYFDYGDYARAGEHFWVRYYDEFDVDLGMPTGPAQETGTGVMIRFFDNGLAILNRTEGDTITVNLSDIASLSGYNPGTDGSYWRLEGGQDLAVNGAAAINNGLPFDSAHPIVLPGRSSSPVITSGIILTREPQQIATIVIDNTDSGTSPGSVSPFENRDRDMPGFTQATTCRAGHSYYTTGCAVFQDPATVPPDTMYLSPPFATAAADSSAFTKFTPGIGISGNYKVYEWHGALADGTAATNVPHTITHYNGEETITVDQTQQIGQWNLLGEYYFDPSSPASVNIAATGTNGIVIADAIKFELVDAFQSDDPVFSDVPSDHWAITEIESLYKSGYLSGCQAEPERKFCPADNLLRSEMAVFILRGNHGGGYQPSQAMELLFNDVPLNGLWFVDWVNALKKGEFSDGCSLDPPLYCPERFVTVAETAVFMLRTRHGMEYEPPVPTDPNLIADTPVDSWYYAWVHAAYNEGLLIPCATTAEVQVCPQSAIQRDYAAYMLYQVK